MLQQNSKVRLTRTGPNKIAVVLFVALVIETALAQLELGTISGVISDPTGARIPNARILVTAPDGSAAYGASDAHGLYSIQVPTGEYRVEVTATGFESSVRVPVKISAGPTMMYDVQLEVAPAEEQVFVSDSATLETEPASNASAIILKGADLDSLSDDPEDLTEDLTALAGPSAGPEGGEVYVDGFSGGKLPPKSAIREIRVNQNPFSAEYDRIGFGRVEILTKLGAPEFHADARFNFGDSMFYARNPFATKKPDFQRRIFEGTVSGPLTQKTSFTLQVERRNVGQTAAINSLILDSAFNPVAYRDVILNPTTNTEISVRLDSQLNENHTLMGRYEWEKNTEINAGLDSFSLLTTGYNSDEREHLFQMTETAILNPKAIHEVRFQYRRSHDVLRGARDAPTVEVPGAFVGGGSTMGLSGLIENRYEVHDLLSLIRGQHNFKMGGRLRIINESNRSMENYNGVFTFASLDSYRLTERGLSNGLLPSDIRALGGGASQFTIASGNPVAKLTQVDVGLFVQDDWRIRNNLTLSGGLRFEKQTNIHDWKSWAPRVGLAWAPRSGNSQQPWAVIRAGFGFFYNRIRESLVLETKRLNGASQQGFRIPDPDFYPRVPSASELSGYQGNQVVRILGDGLRAPYVEQLVLTIERQFLDKFTVTASYTRSTGVDNLRSRNINAFLPGTYDPLLPDSGVRPGPGGNIYAYESEARFRQHQFITNANARISKKYTLSAYYTWSKAKSDTDGAETFPCDPWDLSSEYGRAAYDVAHRAFFSGTLTAPLGLVLNPFVVMHSGAPFDITTGEDLNGDSLFNDRPAWATDLTRPSVVRTAWGTFDVQPQRGQVIIPRNLGSSPGMFAVNLRLTKSLGFGPRVGSAENGGQSGIASATPVGHAGHGPHHDQDSSSSGRRFTLSFSVAARNLFNKVNLDTPVGNLSSPVFGHSSEIHGFGHGTPSANRTIDFQVRFSL